MGIFFILIKIKMKNKEPLISVVVTYYKKKKFIKKTLNSILDQNYSKFEIIFVYDDNDKNDLQYIKNILSTFKIKKLIINRNNLGVAKSRNLAIKYCKGSYIAFIDSDDLWKKNKLSYQYNFMKKKSLLFTFTSYDVINENDKIIKSRKVNFDAEYDKLSKSNFIGLSTVMIDRKLLSKIVFPNLKTQEDFGLWLKLIRTGTKLNHISKKLSFWRKTKDSLSSNILYKFRDAFKLFYNYENKNLISSIFSVMILSYNKIVKELK
jgi:teichuronic acid biosynthesis glycosyltransferase TuaG